MTTPPEGQSREKSLDDIAGEMARECNDAVTDCTNVRPEHSDCAPAEVCHIKSALLSFGREVLERAIIVVEAQAQDAREFGAPYAEAAHTDSLRDLLKLKSELQGDRG